jgi:hypothetical protein
MARAVTGLLNGRRIEIEEALDLRDRSERGERPNFRCTECDEPIRAHRSGGHAQAHFEHFDRNPDCPLSDVR